MWMLQDAPYLLEPLVEKWTTQAVVVRLALLTAAAKLFFARPPECRAVLGAALTAAAADTDQDVHDRGLMYFRCAVTKDLAAHLVCYRACLSTCFGRKCICTPHLLPWCHKMHLARQRGERLLLLPCQH